jgi:ABC-type glycerol-3-phosphate transport system permease component
VIESNRFPTYFLNSLIVTGTATLLALVVGVPAGWMTICGHRVPSSPIHWNSRNSGMR